MSVPSTFGLFVDKVSVFESTPAEAFDRSLHAFSGLYMYVHILRLSGDQRLRTTSWEFVSTFDYEWQFYRRRMPFKWTILVRPQIAQAPTCTIEKHSLVNCLIHTVVHRCKMAYARLYRLCLHPIGFTHRD